MTGLLRCPELLGVDSALLAAKADFYVAHLGVTRPQLGRLFVSEPTALAVSLPHLQETVAWLRWAGVWAGVGVGVGVWMCEEPLFFVSLASSRGLVLRLYAPTLRCC